jgi:transcriptional regulator with XRE-family HTH domain
MLAPGLVEQVQRLLDENVLSQRKIARSLGVSRGTVAVIAAGKRPDYDALRRARQSRTSLPPAGPLERCPGCGGMVFMPCLLCRIEALKAESPRMSKLRLRTRPAEPLGLNLKEKDRARYEEVRLRRQQVEQMAPAAADACEAPEPEDDRCKLSLVELCDALEFDGEELPADETLSRNCEESLAADWV